MMDFSKFDNRTAAETGQRLELRDPSTPDGDVLKTGSEPCVVIVRGATAKSVQLAARARAKTKMRKENETRVMEDIHDDLCAAAQPLIVGFENVERDGKPLTSDIDDIKWFLNLTFPVMDLKRDEYGEPVVSEDGTPRFEMSNNPFAKQVTEFSAEQVKQLGNAKKG